MGYVLIGHGGMEVDPSCTSPEMATVAIPRGTTIQFYSDSGQVLSFGPTGPDIFGPTGLDIWQQLQAPWPPLDSSHVTYNLTLSNSEETLAYAFRNNPQFGNNEVLLPGRNFPDPIHLCNGTPETCPTNPEQVAQGMLHECNGVLGLLQGDLYWLACTSFIGLSAEAQPLVEAKLGDRVRGIRLGEDPDASATVSEDERKQIERFNQMAFDYSYDKDSLSCTLIGPAVLIGPGHGIPYQNRLRIAYHGDVSEGQIQFSKGGADGPDWFDVYGVPRHKEDLVRAAIRRFSKGADVQFK
ncbi:hypothetical protein [Streptomyces sp. NPDC051014]|uniref:hypothetical protein n=1 Tax=Streptomyces sp. NPDC051014 TaxID=3155751 RepID=UPI0033F48B91